MLFSRKMKIFFNFFIFSKIWMINKKNEQKLIIKYYGYNFNFVLFVISSTKD